MEMGPLSTGPDEDLVAEVEGGSEVALAEVYRRHGAEVLALARGILGDRSRAADVVQAVFVELWDQPRSFDPGVGSLRSHLLLKARDHSLELLGRGDERRPTEVSTDGFDDLDRRVIELAFLRGHTYREVGQLLNLPEQQVKRQIRFALRRLHASRPD